VLLGGAVLITVAGYVAGSRHDVDGTTEVAALAVLAAGLLAGTGHVRLASGSIAIVTLLLVEKSRLHGLVRRIDDVDLRSGVRFAVMALVILPLLPPGPYGPLGGIKPRELWMLVLFFSGLSFAGYVARRLLGPGQGYLAAGALGGLVSSTNVTLAFAERSRRAPSLERPLAFGAVAANAMLYPRVMVAATFLNASLLMPLLPYLVAPALIAVVVVLSALRRAPAATPPMIEQNPLQLFGALKMALLFQAVLMLVYAARDRWGVSGLYVSAALAGLTDADALTISMARDVAVAMSPAVAATGIAIGVLSNTGVKLALALFRGGPVFRRITGGALVLMLLALLAGLVMDGAAPW
jgi:uncharacterized membrane protein (DUF4010 family)